MGTSSDVMLNDRPIVVAGEALMDLVLDADGGLVGHPGGGPYNVARTVGRLEQPVLYLGRLSTDGFGARLRRELEADSVGVETVVATDAPTTLAVAELNESGGAEYRFYADSTSAPGFVLEEASAVLPPRIGTFCVGTLGLVFEPMATTLETIVGRLDRDTLIALDPNSRPATIRDPAAYRGRLDRLLRRTDVVKASDDDLAWLCPGASPVDAARALLTHNAAVALVTLGGRGALAVTPEDLVEVDAPQVEVVDTIGAGDAFMGAFLAHWHSRALGRDDLTRPGEVADAARFACQVAAITCSRAGADPPRRSELGS
jgi:fructokinase